MAGSEKTKAPRSPGTDSALERQAIHLARLADDRTLIPGIYNYCDRWCERCPLTARCLVSKTEQVRNCKRGGRTAPRDLGNQEFWGDLVEGFALALYMVRRDAKKLGIDLESPEARASANVEESRHRRQAAREGSALHRAATAYGKSARALLDRLPDELRATEAALNTQARLGTGDPHRAAAELHNALEVVHWYQFFIDVKLQRAVASRIDQANEDDGGVPSDADGSAKVALVAIDRSIGAWAIVRCQMDDSKDAILDLLAQLERLRCSVEQEFPNARTFQRPGFDQPGVG